ncbi:MAG TPA: phosphotransferase [Rectinemataceae bacterium]|nr:phosphotransferase [Rectinemataceae bacterium]
MSISEHKGSGARKLGPAVVASGDAVAPAGKGAPKPDTNILEGLRRFIDGRRIEAALPPGLRRRGVVLEGLQPMGGLTNRNYKVFVGGEALVLRLPGRGTGRFIDRSTERANHEAAARAGFTPQSIFFDGRTGVKITRYLHQSRALDPASSRDRETSADVARLLSSFHRSGLRFVNDFDVFRLIRTYERVARGRFARFYDGYAGVRDRVLALERPLSVLAPERVACHNDLVPENILVTPEGLTLIDWEYSGMNDPAWDLASFTLESGYGEEDETRFLAAYYGGPVPERLRIRVETYRLLQDFLWSLWSILQETANRDPRKARSYREYGQDRYARARSRLKPVESRFGISRHLEEPRE